MKEHEALQRALVKAKAGDRSTLDRLAVLLHRQGYGNRKDAFDEIVDVMGRLDQLADHMITVTYCKGQWFAQIEPAWMDHTSNTEHLFPWPIDNKTGITISAAGKTLFEAVERLLAEVSRHDIPDPDGFVRIIS